MISSPVALDDSIRSPGLRVEIPALDHTLTDSMEEGRLAEAVDKVDAELRLPRIQGVQPADDRDDMARREAGRKRGQSAQKKRGVQAKDLTEKKRVERGGFISHGRDRETDPFGQNQHPRNWQR